MFSFLPHVFRDVFKMAVIQEALNLTVMQKALFLIDLRLTKFNTQIPKRIKCNTN
jgi:hypothetical protein